MRNRKKRRIDQQAKEGMGKKHDPDETRTRNLLIRSQTPYPLGHEACQIKNGLNRHIKSFEILACGLML